MINLILCALGAFICLGLTYACIIYGVSTKKNKLVNPDSAPTISEKKAIATAPNAPVIPGAGLKKQYRPRSANPGELEAISERIKSHRCTYCGAVTTQHDILCYNAPITAHRKRYRDADKISNLIKRLKYAAREI